MAWRSHNRFSLPPIESAGTRGYAPKSPPATICPDTSPPQYLGNRMYVTGSASHIYQDDSVYDGESLVCNSSTSKASTKDEESGSTSSSSGSQPVFSEHVKRKIEQRRQDLSELSLLKRIERAEDLDRHAKKILSKSESLDWLLDTDLNMLVYEMEDLEWRVFEVVYIIKPDYKDYAMLIPETDRSILDNSYKLLRRLTKIDGYSQLNVRPITDLPRPCYLPRPIKGHLWEHPAPKPNCVGSFKQSRIPLPFAKGNVMERSHIPPEIHNLIRRLHKAYAKLCTMVDQWFSPGTVKEYVKRAKAKGTHTHPTAKETLPQTAAMETATPMSTKEACPKPAPRRIRVPLPSPRPRLIHNNRYNKVASSGYGRSKKKEKTATEDPKKNAKEILPKPESLDWLHDMDLNMLTYEMEDLEWRVFEVIYVIKPDYKDYSMLIPETDRPVLDDGYNLLQRLAKIDGYSELNVRPIIDLPHPCHLPRPIKGHAWQNPAPKPCGGGFKQSRIPLPYQFAKVNVTGSQRSDISPKIHDLIRRLHKAYGRLCTMVDQWFSPGTVKENVIQATAKGTPNHPTFKGTIARATFKKAVAQVAAKENVTEVPAKETVTQATAKKSVTLATSNETCPQPVPRRIRVPLPSPRPRLIHNNRYNKVASSGYGRCKTKPKPTCIMQTSHSFVSTRNNIAPSVRGQTCQTLQKDPPPPPKVDIRTVARLNGSRLPIPVKLSASSLPTTSSTSSEAAIASKDTSSTTAVASKAPTTDIRTMARLNGSKLPIPIKSTQSTSHLASIRQPTSSMSTNGRHPAQVTNLPQKSIRRVSLRSNLYKDIPSTGYGKAKLRVKTQFFAATDCSSFSTVNSQRPVQPKTKIRKTKQKDSLKPPKPDIRLIARQNGSKIPLPTKLLESESQRQSISGSGNSSTFSTADASDDICSTNTSDVKITAGQKESKPSILLKPGQNESTVKSTTSQNNSSNSTNPATSKDEDLGINPGVTTTVLMSNLPDAPGSKHRPASTNETGAKDIKAVRRLDIRAVARQNGSKLPVAVRSPALTGTSISKDALSALNPVIRTSAKFSAVKPTARSKPSKPHCKASQGKSSTCTNAAASRFGNSTRYSKITTIAGQPVLSAFRKRDLCASMKKPDDPPPAPRPDIRAIARANGSRLPIPIKQIHSTSELKSTKIHSNLSIKNVASNNAPSSPGNSGMSTAKGDVSKLPVTVKATKGQSQTQSAAAPKNSPASKSVADPATKTNIHSIARQNGLKLPTRSPVPIKIQSNSSASSTSSKCCLAPRPEIRDITERHVSKLPVSIMLSTTSPSESNAPASGKSCLARRSDIRDIAKRNGSKLPVPIILSTTSRGDSWASKCVAASTDAQSADNPNIRDVARRNGSKLPVIIKPSQNTSESDGRVNQTTNTVCLTNASLTRIPDSATTASPKLPIPRKQPITSQSASNNIYSGKNGPSASITGPVLMPPMRTTSLREFVEMFRPLPPEKRVFKAKQTHKVISTVQPPTKPAVKPKRPVHPRPPVQPKTAAKPKPAVQPKPTAQPTPVLPKPPIEPKPPILPKPPLQPKSPVQPKSPIQPKSTVQSEPPVQPKVPVLPKHPVQQKSPIPPEPPVQPKQPAQSKQPVQPKSPVQAKSPTKLLLCPKPPSTPPPENSRRRIRVVSPALDPDKPCPIKPARGILKTLCERMDFREMDAMFEANNHPDYYPPLCQNLDRFFYRLMAPRRLVPMGLESWTVLNRRRVQFDPESKDQFEAESAGKYEPDLEDEEFLELERQCNAEFENGDELNRES